MRNTANDDHFSDISIVLPRAGQPGVAQDVFSTPEVSGISSLCQKWLQTKPRLRGSDCCLEMLILLNSQEVIWFSPKFH